MIMKLKFVLVAVAFMLSGCPWPVQKETTAIKTQTVVADIPQIYLMDCEETPPPDKTIYNSSSLQDKENLLIDYSLDLSADLNKCRLKIVEIRKRLVDQKARFETKKE